MAQLLTLFQGLLDGTTQTLYTVPDGKTLIPKTLLLCNVTQNGTSAVDVWILPTGVSTVSDQYKVICNKAVINQETVFINPDIFLQAGYKVVVDAVNANTLSCLLSGVVM